MDAVSANKNERLTQRQKQTLVYIYSCIRYSGYPPTLSQLREELQVVSNQAVIDLLKILENKKYIQKEENSARALKVTQKGYEELNVSPYAPMVGTTAAGPFMDTLEQYGEWREISPDLSKLSDKLALFKISSG